MGRIRKVLPEGVSTARVHAWRKRQDELKNKAACDEFYHPRLQAFFKLRHLGLKTWISITEASWLADLDESKLAGLAACIEYSKLFESGSTKILVKPKFFVEE